MPLGAVHPNTTGASEQTVLILRQHIPPGWKHDIGLQTSSFSQDDTSRAFTIWYRESVPGGTLSQL